MNYEDDNDGDNLDSPPMRLFKRRRTAPVEISFSSPEGCVSESLGLPSPPTCSVSVVGAATERAPPVVDETSTHETTRAAGVAATSVETPKETKLEIATTSASSSSTSTNSHQTSYTVSHAQQQVALAAQRVFHGIGCGFSESVYRDALCVELQHCLPNAKIDCEVVYPVRYRGRYVGTVRADIVLQCKTQDGGEGVGPDERLVIELKTTNTPLTAINARQLLTYLRLENVCRGVLINFEQRDLMLASRVSTAIASSSTLSSAPSDRGNCVIVDDSALFGDDPDRCVCGHKHTAKVLFLMHSAAATKVGKEKDKR